jgi:hypothetical protein
LKTFSTKVSYFIDFYAISSHLIQGFKELDKRVVIKYDEAIFNTGDTLYFPHSSGKEVGFSEPVTVS